MTEQEAQTEAWRRFPDETEEAGYSRGLFVSGAAWERSRHSPRVVVDDFEGSDNVAAPSKSSQSLSEVTTENSPTLAVHAQAAQFGYTLSSTEAAYIAEAAIVASGLLEESRVVVAAPSDTDREAQEQATLYGYQAVWDDGKFDADPAKNAWTWGRVQIAVKAAVERAARTSQPVQVEVTDDMVDRVREHRWRTLSGRCACGDYFATERAFTHHALSAALGGGERPSSPPNEHGAALCSSCGNSSSNHRMAGHPFSGGGE